MTFEAHHYNYWSAFVSCDAVTPGGWEGACQCCGSQGEGHGWNDGEHALRSWRSRGWLIDGDRALCPHHLDGIVPREELLSTPTKCPLCDRVARDWAMRDHVRKVHHMTVVGAEAIAAGAEPHPCRSCDFIGGSITSIRAHVRRVHPEVAA